MELKRDFFADNLKGSLIFLVVWGHLIQLYRIADGQFWDDYVYKAIYMFHMPLFVAISAYYTHRTLDRKTILNFVKERVVFLLVPLVFWGVLMGLYDIFLSNQHIENKVYHIYASVIYSYWFIWVTLIHSFIIAVLKLIKLNNRYVIGVLGLLSMLIPAWWNNITLIFAKDMFCFFTIGYILAYLDLAKMFNFCKRYIYFFIGVSVVCYLFWSREALIYYTPADIFHLKYSILRFVSAIAMSICFITLLFYMSSYFSDKIKPLAYLGRETLGIYLMQGLLFFILSKILHIQWSTPIISFVLVVVVFAIVAIMYKFIVLLEKNKITAFLLLGKKWK